MTPCGDGPIDQDAAHEFTRITYQLADKCQQSVDELAAITDKLRASALTYGNTEADLTAAFNPATYQFRHAPYDTNQCLADPQDLA
jgi:hypothetical protein